VDAGSLEPITIGDSDKVQVGDYVLAVGNPLASAERSPWHRQRYRRANWASKTTKTSFRRCVDQPGNSGGALVNDRGELIGINTAILANGSAGNQGIGFAVPVDVARSVMDQIVNHGKVTAHTWA